MLNCRVKYFINERIRGAVTLAEHMREFGVEFSVIPTFGPLAIWIDDYACYGPTAVEFAVNKLIEEKINERS